MFPFALLDRSRYNVSIYGYELLYNLLLFLTSSCQITYIYVQGEVRKRDKAPRRDATLRSLLSRTTVLLIAFRDRSSSLRRFFFFFFASPSFVQFTENPCVVSASLLPSPTNCSVAPWSVAIAPTSSRCASPSARWLFATPFADRL